MALRIYDNNDDILYHNMNHVNTHKHRVYFSFVFILAVENIFNRVKFHNVMQNFYIQIFDKECVPFKGLVLN